MKIEINKKEYTIISCQNSSLYDGKVSREAEQIILNKDFDFSLFTDNLEYSIIDDTGKKHNLSEFCIVGEIQLKRDTIVVYMCKKTIEELQNELIQELLKN